MPPPAFAPPRSISRSASPSACSSPTTSRRWASTSSSSARAGCRSSMRATWSAPSASAAPSRPTTTTRSPTPPPAIRTSPRRTEETQIMDAKNLFLAQHAAVQSAAVGGNPASAAERAFAGLSDEQMRVRPREDLNSLAWLMWHIARAEDVFANLLVSGRDQVLDGGWSGRLMISRPDFGIGMTKPEVAELSAKIDIAALRDYRDAVGRRTREIVGAFGPGDWKGEIEASAVEKAATLGCFGTRAEGMVKAFGGRPRSAVVPAILIMHSAG